ncbi:MAG: ABC transporter substrate-binding protein [Actinomycetota bacterium]|nr:ABC transporter substrate-binding protein [Actinomycetota bacterium]
MTSRPRSRALVAVLAAIVLAAACTDGDEAGEGPSSSARGSQDGTSPGADGSGGGASPTVPGGFTDEDDVLTVASKEPATLDPMRIQDPGSVLVARQLFEGLTRWDPAQEKVLPATAESWTAADGGRTYTFRLRPGETFHDGSPVTARDFTFAFDRVAKKSNASDLAYTLERVEGFDQVNGLGESDHLSGLQAIDDLTLRIRLTEPFRGFPAVLTHPGLVPLPAPAVRDYDAFLAAPVGNGPFRMAEPWAPGAPVILRAYDDALDPPELDGIRFVPSPDAAASWPLFVGEGLDVAEVPSGQFEAARRAFGDQGYRPFLAGYYFGLNLRSDQLDSITVRKAVSRAIDRREIATEVYKGNMELPRGIVPAGMPGFHENICLTLCRYSPEIARGLVRRIPPARRRISIQFNREDPHGQVARLVKEDLESVGLRVSVEGYGFPEYLRLLREGKQSAYRLGWIAEYPEADVFLSSLFESDSPDNHSGFASDRVDALLERAHRTASDQVRVQHYIEAEKAILRRLPVVPIGSFVTHWVAQPRVEDIEFDVMGGFDAARISLGERPS